MASDQPAQVPRKDEPSPETACGKGEGAKSRPVIEQLRDFDRPYPRIPTKTVYILGAGFSASLGYPVMSSFFSSGLALLKSKFWKKGPLGEAAGAESPPENALIHSVEALLQKYMPLFAGQDKAEPSLEDLYCAVDLFSGRHVDGKWVNEDRETLCDFIQEVFDQAREKHAAKLAQVRQRGESHKLVPTVAQAFFHTTARAKCARAAENLPQTTSEACLYRAFLSQLYSADTLAEPDLLREAPDYATSAIVSLNYDCVVEEKARDFGGKLKIFYGRDVAAGRNSDPRADDIFITEIGGGSRKTDERLVPVIKLHGSLNWRFAGNDRQKVVLHTAVKGEAAGEAGLSQQCLIFPTWQRDPLGGTVFDTLFREARIHLRLASRIVIIGYSLPETDRYLNYLFADVISAGSMPDVEICNHGDPEEWRRRAQRIFGPRLTAAKLTIRRDFSEHVRANPDPISPAIV
jgi:hypothetical protein